MASNAANSPRRGGLSRYDSINNQPRPNARTFSTSAIVDAVVNSIPRPMAGEKMNSRISPATFTLPSFGPVLSAFRRFHPRMASAFGPCHGGVIRAKSSVSRSLVVRLRSQPCSFGRNRSSQPDGVACLNATPATTDPPSFSNLRPCSALQSGRFGVRPGVGPACHAVRRIAANVSQPVTARSYASRATISSAVQT